MKNNAFQIGFLSMLVLAFSVQASDVPDDQVLSVNELNQIRSVSQAILKTRGQERRLVLAETADTRAGMEEVKTLLEAAATDFDLPTIQMHEAPQPLPVSLEAAKKGKAGVGAIQRQQLAIHAPSTEKGVEKVRKALGVMAERRQKLEKQAPAFWKVWEEADERKERISRQLKILEEELVLIEQLPRSERSRKIRDLISRLEGKQARSGEPAPTITSITKHVSK